MPTRKCKSARQVAAETLRRCDPARDYVSTILDPLLEQTEEKQRTTDLVYGTIRNLHAIDAVIAQFSGRRTDRIAPPLLSVIRVGVYELACNPATPTYSIVNEAANNAAGGRKQTGFVNAVLRGIVRHITNRDTPLATANLRRTLIRDPDKGCEFDTDFLPDPPAALPEYLSTCFSLPSWLVREWLDTYGPDQTRQICFGSNRKPSLYIRINPLRTTPQDLLAQFEQAGVNAEIVTFQPLAHDGDSQSRRCSSESRLQAAKNRVNAELQTDMTGAMLRITAPHAVTELPGFHEGLFTVQDLSAARAVRLLQPQPGWTILDLCAAPGTKTTQLAELTRDAATILATDINPERLKRVEENVTRLGLKSITILPYAEVQPGKIGPFDAILLDVPCSNTGVLARRVEARHRLKPEAVNDLATTQRALLEKAATLLKPIGRICYSTCSIQESEDQDVIENFLATHSHFALLREHLTLPTPAPPDHDGAYAAVLHARC